MIDVTEAPNGSCSILKIKTADRPGLLVDIVRVLKDVNLNVVSAEVDTIGAEAQDDFFVTYRVRRGPTGSLRRAGYATALRCLSYTPHPPLLFPNCR